MQNGKNPKPRTYDLVVFDNDGTLNTQTSCWQYIHTGFGSYESVGRQLLEHHLEHRTPYDEYARANLVHWKGRSKKEFLDIIRAIPLRESAIEVLHFLVERGYKTGVISSGFSFWRDRFAEEYGIEFDFFCTNEIIFDANDLCTGEIEMNATDNVFGKDKAAILIRECDALGIPPERTVFVGDGWGDVGAMKLTARAYCVGDNFPEVREASEWLGHSLKPLMDRL